MPSPPKPTKQVHVVQTTQTSCGSDAQTPNEMKQHDNTKLGASTSHESLPPTRSNSPVLSPQDAPLTHDPNFISLAQQFVDVLKDLAGQGASTSPSASGTTTPQAAPRLDTTPATKGSRLEVKDIHEAWDTKTYAYKIVAAPSPPKITELDTFAFLVRTRALKNARSIVYVDVNSPGLRDILKVVLKDIKWLSLADERPSFEQNLLFQYLPELEAYWGTASKTETHSSESLAALAPLVSTIKARYAATSERLEPLLEANKITYDLLWALFKPIDYVITRCDGSGEPKCLQYQIGEERTTNQGGEYFDLQCQYFDYDGRVFGLVTEHVRIPRFNGARAITDLEVYPLRFHASPEEMMQSLADRGRRFMNLRNSHYQEYDGTAFRRTKEGLFCISVQSRIMVDVNEFRKILPAYERIVLKKIEDDFFGALVTEQPRVMHYNAESMALPDRLLPLCPPTVLGFSLGNKFWGEFSIDHIHEVEWQNSLFDRLSLPSAVKQTVKSMTQPRTAHTTERGDRGPNLGHSQVGMRMLLHGPPGVGKTLTAEALAENHERPLYSVSTGELSSDAAELEPQLTRILRAASAWQAVLLIDEADIFLQQRTSNTLDRNRLVGIFLRKLESFDGILILTTNRFHDIDSAILDRMHLKVAYHALDKTAKKAVFASVLQELCSVESYAGFEANLLDRLATLQVNGRQIKNTLSIANALATGEEKALSSKHITQALAVNNLFLPDSSDEGDGMDGLYD